MFPLTGLSRRTHACKGRQLVHLVAFLMAFLVVCVVGLLCLIHLLRAMFESELEPDDDMDEGSGARDSSVGSLENGGFAVRRQDP